MKRILFDYILKIKNWKEFCSVFCTIYEKYLSSTYVTEVIEHWIDPMVFKFNVFNHYLKATQVE